MIILLLIPFSLGYIPQETLQLTSTIIAGVAAVYTLLSGAEYIYANREYVLRALTTQN